VKSFYDAGDLITWVISQSDCLIVKNCDLVKLRINLANLSLKRIKDNL
jgi:hypothetical protein